MLDLAVETVEQRRIRVDQHVKHGVQQLLTAEHLGARPFVEAAEFDRFLGRDSDDVVGRVDDVDLHEIVDVVDSCGRAVGDDLHVVLVLLDLRALIELLEVLHGERVQIERLTRNRDLLIGGAMKI